MKDVDTSGLGRSLGRAGRALVLSLACGLAACSSLGTRLADNFSQSVVNSDDPATIEAGLPSYLMLLDTLVRTEPDSVALRQAAAALNTAYAGTFIKDEARTLNVTAKALDYAFGALCHEIDELCAPRGGDLESFQRLLAEQSTDEVALLYTVGSTWAGWIQARSGDFNAIADLPRVRVLMERVVALDEGYQDGVAHLYLGVMATVLTPALGGRPEEGRAHFEKAISLSQGRNLLAKVYYAKQYARGVFDRELHDRLLQEVLAAEPRARGWTLSNLLAQQEAKSLLASADDYF